jgi:hypothetical protein
MGKSLDSTCIAPPFGRMLSVRLIIIGTIVVIVPFFTLLLFEELTLQMPVFDLDVSISIADDITQISVILVSSSTAFLRWRLLAESPSGLYQWSSS